MKAKEKSHKNPLFFIFRCQKIGRKTFHVKNLLPESVKAVFCCLHFYEIKSDCLFMDADFTGGERNLFPFQRVS